MTTLDELRAQAMKAARAQTNGGDAVHELGWTTHELQAVARALLAYELLHGDQRLDMLGAVLTRLGIEPPKGAKVTP